MEFESIFPEFYYIISFCAVSFIIGYVFALFSKEPEPKAVKKMPIISNEAVEPSKEPLLTDAPPRPAYEVGKQSASDKDEEGRLDFNSIVPGKIRAAKSYSVRDEKKKSGNN